MVSEKIYKDLQRMNRSIIGLGDHGQLPPIGDNFNLLADMTFKLKHIHRQALNSPIIALSKFIREYGYIPSNRIFSKDVLAMLQADEDNWAEMVPEKVGALIKEKCLFGFPSQKLEFEY